MPVVKHTHTLREVKACHSLAHLCGLFWPSQSLLIHLFGSHLCVYVLTCFVCDLIFGATFVFCHLETNGCILLQCSSSQRWGRAVEIAMPPSVRQAGRDITKWTTKGKTRQYSQGTLTCEIPIKSKTKSQCKSSVAVPSTPESRYLT